MRFFKILLKFVAALVLLAVSGFLLMAVYMLSFYNSNAKASADCALVFGAAVEPDGSASALLYDRVASAVKLYQDGKVSCLLLSGAPSAFSVHEVDVMKKIARSLGVSEKDIKEDKNGLNTCFSMKNADKSLSYILLTNDFHLARVAFFADKFNLKYSLQSAYESQGPYLKSNYFFFRETLANLYYRIFFDERCDTSLKWVSDKAYNWVNKF